MNTGQIPGKDVGVKWACQFGERRVRLKNSEYGWLIDGIYAGSAKSSDAQMLLDPFEE